MAAPYAPRRAREEKHPLSRRTRSVLLRLTAAALLFAVCFVGKTAFPRQTEGCRQQLSAMLEENTELHRAFSQLGEELREQEEVFQAVGDWCVSVFGVEGVTVPGEETVTVPPQEDAQTPQGEEKAGDGERAEAS